MKTLKQQRLDLLIKCYREVKTLEQTNEELQKFETKWLTQKRQEKEQKLLTSNYKSNWMQAEDIGQRKAIDKLVEELNQ